MATNTHPGPWWLEADETILTVIELLNEQAEAIEKASKGR